MTTPDEVRRIVREAAREEWRRVLAEVEIPTIDATKIGEVLHTTNVAEAVRKAMTSSDEYEGVAQSERAAKVLRDEERAVMARRDEARAHETVALFDALDVLVPGAGTSAQIGLDIANRSIEAIASEIAKEVSLVRALFAEPAPKASLSAGVAAAPSIEGEGVRSGAVEVAPAPERPRSPYSDVLDTARTYIHAGYEPLSVLDAIGAGDLDLLVHGDAQ